VRYVGTFLAVISGLPIIRWSYATTWRPGLSLAEWILFIGLLVATVLAVIAIHEFGHLLGGRFAGFRFRLLAIGPLRVVRANGRIRFGLNRDLLQYPGVAGSSPDDPTGMRRRMAIVLAAGPLASLAAGGIALALMLVDGPDALTRGRFAEFAVSRALALFAAGSVATGVITLLPGGTRLRPTDGSRILELLGNGPEAERAAAILSLNSLALAGRSPVEWPDALVERVLSPADGTPTELRALLLAAAALAAKGDLARAECILERAVGIEDAPHALRAEALERAARFGTEHRGGPILARQYARRAERTAGGE
jgi:hypothetical protein